MRSVLCCVAAGCAAAASLCGCGEAAPDARVETAVSVEAALAAPLSAGQALSAAAVVASLPEAERPQFEPAMWEVSIEGRGGRELAEAYRRQFREAVNLPEQAARWQGNRPLARACEREGLSPQQLALCLMQIGCAHHAAEVGGRTDLGAIRAQTKTEIGSLADRLDRAPDLLSRRTLASGLRAAVALDTYLTLLEGVPRQNRAVVAENRAALAAVLPARSAMQIVPTVR